MTEKQSLKRRITRSVQWVLINGAVAVCAYLAIRENTVWAENIWIFSIWVQFVVGLLLFTMKPEAILKLRAQGGGRSVPRSVAFTYDLIMLAALAAMGWFWTATAQFLAILFEARLYDCDFATDVDGKEKLNERA
ncbi:MAG: hypothetical protein LLG06_01835 [Desulfobacteraceae bacterium]|nr:hypothetical protein [Desulfobacteraceae bacterium]